MRAIAGEFFFHNFDIFFAQFFNLPYFPDIFSKYVKFNELDFLASGEFHVTERKYFRTLENMEKKLFDKNGP